MLSAELDGLGVMVVGSLTLRGASWRLLCLLTQLGTRQVNLDEHFLGDVVVHHVLPVHPYGVDSTQLCLALLH